MLVLRERRRRARHPAAALAVTLMALVASTACGDASLPVPPPRPRSDTADAAAPAAEARFDLARPPPGVPDGGRTSGLVRVFVRRAMRCAAALVASNVALAPAACLRASRCAFEPASDVTLATGDDAPSTLPSVVAVVPPTTCDGPLVALLLSQHVAGVAPLALRGEPLAAGEFLRVVGFARLPPAPVGSRAVIDHRVVTSSARDHVLVDAAPCALELGAASLDEANGELVAVATGPPAGAACDASTLRAWPLAASRDWLEDVWPAAVGALAVSVPDAGASALRKGKARKLTFDLGARCDGGADCAAGACVLEPATDGGYCSRSCGVGDRCPSGFRCHRPKGGVEAACVFSR